MGMGVGRRRLGFRWGVRIRSLVVGSGRGGCGGGVESLGGRVGVVVIFLGGGRGGGRRSYSYVLISYKVMK